MKTARFYILGIGIISLLISLVMISTNTITATTVKDSYCTIDVEECDMEHISNVELNTGTRSSSCQPYSDYTSSVFTTLEKGNTYTIQVTVQNTCEFVEYVKVWIDFNNDYDFYDSGEEIDLGYYEMNGTQEFSETFTVPEDAVSGNTRMRVALRYQIAPLVCGFYDYGEVEDYTINIESSETTTTTTSTTTTIQGGCPLAGDYPPCGDVALGEVVSFITLWANGEASLSDVVALISAWAS